MHGGFATLPSASQRRGSRTSSHRTRAPRHLGCDGSAAASYDPAVSGAGTAATLIKYWCRRHQGGHDSSPEASALADCMPLTHVMNDQSLGHVVETLLLEPVTGKPLCFFAGPGRRKPRGRTAAVAVFRAGFENSARVTSCVASQYDSGGWRRAHMTKSEAQAAQANLTMNDSTFRSYLEAFLHCAFEVPVAYLSESPGPDLDLTRGLGKPWASALSKALGQRTDSASWTVEVRLEVAEAEIDLVRCNELEALAVFGGEHEPSFTEIEKWLGDDLTEFVPVAHERTNEEGLRLSNRLADEDAAALDWSADRIRRMVNPGSLGR